jgi:transposase
VAASNPPQIRIEVENHGFRFEGIPNTNLQENRSPVINFRQIQSKEFQQFLLSVNRFGIFHGRLHMLQSGARWRDCPREYGPYTTIYNRFNRWAKRERWCAIFEALAKPGEDSVVLSLDSTSIKAHRCASGGKGGSIIKQSAARAEAARQKSMR